MRKLKFQDEEMTQIHDIEHNKLKRRGMMFILSSPSGAGKSSIAHGLLTRDPNLSLSISATTRPKRENEINDVDYHFVTVPRFQEMLQHGEFLEHAQVFGNYYGTPKGPVMRALHQGQDVLFDIDWQGTQQLCQINPQDLVSIFILPPTIQALHERLKRRAQDSDKIIDLRMASAKSEMSHWAEYDYVIVNEDLEQSINNALSILKSERLKRRRQTGLSGFVTELTTEEF
ncbi:MAG: guanylate kinase [Alphaproteobacteria bacterium]|nr:guanylate kinase [Alphaproteobacteria bacterium]